MPKDEIQRIREDLEKHGFTRAHEIEVSRLLSSKGWTTVDRYYFVDEEVSKQREIDCIATKAIGEVPLGDTETELDLQATMKSFARARRSSLNVLMLK